MTHPLSQRAGLSATALKLIAVAAMTGDHLGWAFLPNASAAGVLVHLLGRITMPVMCFFIAEGYRCTRSVPRYALRLFFCALASAIPYSYYQTGELFSNPFSVLYTLLLGLLAIWACDRIPQPFLRAAVLLGLFLLSVPGDWGAYAVGWCLIFFLLRDRPGPCAACFCALCLLHVLEAFSAGVSCGWGAAELFCATFVQSGATAALFLRWPPRRCTGAHTDAGEPRRLPYRRLAHRRRGLAGQPQASGRLALFLSLLPAASDSH